MAPDDDSTTDDMSDGALIEASVRRPELFGEIYRRRSEELMAYFYRRTLDPHVAADLLAETFAIGFSKRKKFSSRQGSGQMWLYGIARIELARFHRKRSVELRAVRKLGIDVPTLSDDDIARIESLLDAEASRDALQNAMSVLSDVEREAVTARYVDGEDYETMARNSGASPGALRVRVHRGLGRLAAELGR